VELLVIRHAVAELRKVFAETGQDDTQRPLTKKGRRRMEAAVRGLRTLVPRIDMLAASPLVRAAQTAEIVAACYKSAERLELDPLAPTGDQRAILTWLQMQDEGSTIAIVGHEPDLGKLTSWLLATPDSHFLELKKGGVCLLEWPVNIAAGDAVLRWLLTAASLRKLGKGR
jgi:phosphohistidine phosphatase